MGRPTETLNVDIAQRAAPKEKAVAAREAGSQEVHDGNQELDAVVAGIHVLGLCRQAIGEIDLPDLARSKRQGMELLVEDGGFLHERGFVRR